MASSPTMDEVTETLAASFSVSNTPNDTATPHPRFSQFKIKNNLPNQADRRRKLLDFQKQKRYDYVNHVRRLAENDWSLDIRDDASCVIMADEEHGRLDDDEMDWMVQYCKPPRFYKNQLMLSEWLVEVPDNLTSDWVVVPCPEGKRSLVVASKGKTIAYTKSGCRVNTFPSMLPGGNRQQPIQSGNYTLLDCIFSLPNRTYYVLDVLCWKGHPVLDSETEFRFYWVNNKLSEIPEVSQPSKYNPYSFVALHNYACQPSELERLMSGSGNSIPFDVPLDGLLFYHKRTHYTHGVTPLVGWLKAYMLPEVLGVTVSSHFDAEKPENYTCIGEHLKKTLEKVKRTRNKMDYQETPAYNVKIDGLGNESGDAGVDRGVTGTKRALDTN